MSWDLQTSAGLDGTSILWRGTWSSASSYNPYDAVYSVSNGSSYISKTNNANKDPVSNPSDWDVLAAGSGLWLPRNYLTGLTIANNATDAANDIDINAGECRDSTNFVDIRLSAGLIKRLDAAWVAGTNQGGRDTGAISDNWWHVFAIWNPTTSVGDVLFSQSLASPTLPSGFTAKRRLGSVVRNVSLFGGIRQFVQNGDWFEWIPGYREVSGLAVASPYNVLTTTYTPPGMPIQALFGISANNNTTSFVLLIKNPAQSTAFSGVAYANAAGVAGTPDIMATTNSSSQVLVSFPSGPGVLTIYLATVGYWDQRGTQGSNVY